MAIQIINCPACSTFLLEDTAECHACGHVLNAAQLEASKLQVLPTDQAVDSDMDICSSCGETCRKGLVRCWNCGTFMRAEIEASYRQRMESSSNTQAQQFDLPELDASSVTEVDSMTRRNDSSADMLPMGLEEDDADDFELSDEVQMSESDDSAFDLSDTFQLRSDGGSSATESSTFALAPIAEAPGRTSTPPQEIDTIPLMSSMPEESEAPAPIESLDEAPAKEAAKVSPEDELLKIAADEEAEIQKARKGVKSKDTFVVFCPQGHRIRVRERFRGKSGKCPKCASAFIVPQKSSPKAKKKTDIEISAVSGAAAAPTGRYARWLDDVHLHQVVPEKLKIKADSLLNDFQAVDVGFSNGEILVVTLVAAGGLFGSNAKKKPAVRTAMLEYFNNASAAPDGLTAAAKRIIPADTFSQLVLAQPVPVGVESMFGNIPVFGTGRIAVRLPRNADDKSTQYLSFSLSEFRAFSLALQTVCGIEGFGGNSEIPMTEYFETFKCHYSEAPVQSLQLLEYYEKDPHLKLEISGWKCSGCGLIVSEEARKKEKIGGLNGKGIAKAKCPKCSQKFGSNPMYTLAATAAPAAAQPAAEA